MSFGKKLKAYRLDMKRTDPTLSQPEFARRAGVSARTLSRIETGIAVELETQYRICHNLGLDPKEYVDVPAKPDSGQEEIKSQLSEALTRAKAGDPDQTDAILAKHGYRRVDLKKKAKKPPTSRPRGAPTR